MPRPEGEVHAGDPHGGVGVAVNGLRDKVLRQGLIQSDGPAILNPDIGGAAGLVDERDAAEVVGTRVGGAGPGTSGIAGLLDNLHGAWQVDGIVVAVNDELDLRHGGN